MKFTSTESGRLNKILANTGVYSRREADKAIENAKITVNSKIAVIGQQIQKGDIIEIKTNTQDLVYFLYNKKKGEILDKKEFIKLNKKYILSPIDKIDKDGEGLTLYSNDYIFINKILSPENKIEKEYNITTRESIRAGIPEILLRGVNTQEDQYAPVKKAEIFEDNPRQIRITLIENKKHDIRRMLNALNLTVNVLKRIRIAKWKSINLKSGTYIEINPQDI